MNISDKDLIPVRAPVLQAIQRYLDARPHVEVRGLMDAIDEDLQMFAKATEEAPLEAVQNSNA